MRDRMERAFAFACAVQSAVDVDAAPTMAANAIRLARPIEMSRDWVTRNELDGEQTGGKGTAPSSARSGRIHIYPLQHRLRGRGAAYGPAALPNIDPVLRAILGVRAIDTTASAEKVTYSGADSGEPLLTCIGQAAKEQWKALNAVPRSARITTDAGGHLLLETEIAGVGQPPTQQLLQEATLDSVVPPLFKGGATFTLNGVALKPIQFTLDFGITQMDAILDGSAGDAWEGFGIADRQPRGTMQVHMRDLADFDPYALNAASTNFAFVGVFGSVQYNRVRILADRMEIMNVSTPTRGGAKIWEMEFKINRAASPSVNDPAIIFD